MLRIAKFMDSLFHQKLFSNCYTFCPQEAERAFDRTNLILNARVWAGRDNIKDLLR